MKRISILIAVLMVATVGCQLTPKLGAKEMTGSRRCYRSVGVYVEMYGLRPTAVIVGNCALAVEARSPSPDAEE